MQRPIGRTLGLISAALLGMVSCGRSENIGWAEREQPAGSSRVAAASEAPVASQAADASGAAAARQAEYQSLLVSLEPLREQALADPEIVALSNQFQASLEAELSAGSELFRKLIERRAEIEARFKEAEQKAEVLAEEERALLSEHYGNLQRRLGPEFARLMQEPQFVAQLKSLQTAVLVRMREIDPARVGEIDRMEALGAEMFAQLEAIGSMPGGPAPTGR